MLAPIALSGGDNANGFAELQRCGYACVCTRAHACAGMHTCLHACLSVFNCVAERLVYYCEKLESLVLLLAFILSIPIQHLFFMSVGWNQNEFIHLTDHLGTLAKTFMALCTMKEN